MANVNQVLKIERDETLCTGVGVVCVDGLYRAVYGLLQSQQIFPLPFVEAAKLFCNCSSVSSRHVRGMLTFHPPYRWWFTTRRELSFYALEKQSMVHLAVLSASCQCDPPSHCPSSHTRMKATQKTGWLPNKKKWNKKLIAKIYNNNQDCSTVCATTSVLSSADRHCI